MPEGWHVPSSILRTYHTKFSCPGFAYPWPKHWWKSPFSWEGFHHNSTFLQKEMGLVWNQLWSMFAKQASLLVNLNTGREDLLMWLFNTITHYFPFIWNCHPKWLHNWKKDWKNHPDSKTFLVGIYHIWECKPVNPRGRPSEYRDKPWRLNIQHFMMRFPATNCGSAPSRLCHVYTKLSTMRICPIHKTILHTTRVWRNTTT